VSSLVSGVTTASARFLKNSSSNPSTSSIESLLTRGGAAISTSVLTNMGASQETFLNSGKFKLFLLVLMVIQNSSVVLIGRFTRASVPKDQLYIVSHFIVVTELTKLILSALLEQIYYKPIHTSIQEHILDKPLDFLRIMIPALLYLVQNSLLYVALSNLSAPLFQVCYQAKLLTTALVSVLLLQRRYSVRQWTCLSTLGLGVAAVVLGEKKAAEASADIKTEHLFVGLIAVSISCFSSAFAGVYFEKVLKRPGTEPNPPSLWMRNIQLATFSVIIALCQFAYQQHSSDEESLKPFMFGFSPWVWTLVLIQAGGGLLVAAIIKYADNVLKGLATGVAVVVSTLCSMVLFKTPLTMQFAAGASVILTSVFFFTNNIPGAKVPKSPPPSEVSKADIESSTEQSSKDVEVKPLTS